MHTTQLELETVTPMFLHGHDNTIVELRPPPFKALFRYWWRTVQNCDADTLYKPLPHKPDNDRFGKKINAFNIEQPFELSLITKTEAEADYYRQVAKLGFLLGGIGARSRRGFGSIRETEKCSKGSVPASNTAYLKHI